MKKLKDFTYLHLKNYSVKSLIIKSHSLRANPLKDPFLRHNPVLIPRDEEIEGIVLVLAGFSGNGPTYLSPKGFEENYAETIDRLTTQGKAPKAAYIFVDAWTSLGGSQFLNSSAVGKYEDYIVKDLLRETQKTFGKDQKIAIMGGSSGGYGALHLATKYPHVFSYLLAVAPDSAFEISALLDFYKVSTYLANFQQKDFLAKLKSGELSKLRDFHTILNCVAMSACYSPKGTQIELPVDLYQGTIRSTIWKKWQEKDPVVFLAKRISAAKRLKGIFLEVGKKDEFKLQFGARRIHNLWKKNKIPHTYNEFDGGHFDLSSRREVMLTWLHQAWMT